MYLGPEAAREQEASLEGLLGPRLGPRREMAMEKGKLFS